MSAFLWPHATYNIRSLKKLGATTAVIEEELHHLFNDGFPVVLSSARAGLALALSASGMQRLNLVKVPPYSSHCVLEAVSRVATPLPALAQGSATFEVVYHQWGYIQSRQIKAPGLIEDACDTLCVPGTRLFPLGGRFELWSLPKILGCSCGGVLWCRKEEDAKYLRTLRDKRDRAALQWILRLLGSRITSLGAYWEGQESSCGNLPAFATAEILNAIQDWDFAVTARRERLNLLERYTPTWLQGNNIERLPCALPLLIDPQRELNFTAFGITTGKRHFERVMENGAIALIEVLPIPLHHHCSMDTLRNVLQTLQKINY